MSDTHISSTLLFFVEHNLFNLYQCINLFTSSKTGKHKLLNNTIDEYVKDCLLFHFSDEHNEKQQELELNLFNINPMKYSQSQFNISNHFISMLMEDNAPPLSTILNRIHSNLHPIVLHSICEKFGNEDSIRKSIHDLVVHNHHDCYFGSNEFNDSAVQFSTLRILKQTNLKQVLNRLWAKIPLCSLEYAFYERKCFTSKLVQQLMANFRYFEQPHSVIARILHSIVSHPTCVSMNECNEEWVENDEILNIDLQWVMIDDHYTSDDILSQCLDMNYNTEEAHIPNNIKEQTISDILQIFCDYFEDENILKWNQVWKCLDNIHHESHMDKDSISYLNELCVKYNCFQHLMNSCLSIWRNSKLQFNYLTSHPSLFMNNHSLHRISQLLMQFSTSDMYLMVKKYLQNSSLLPLISCYNYCLKSELLEIMQKSSKQSLYLTLYESELLDAYAFCNHRRCTNDVFDNNPMIALKMMSFSLHFMNENKNGKYRKLIKYLNMILINDMCIRYTLNNMISVEELHVFLYQTLHLLSFEQHFIHCLLEYVLNVHNSESTNNEQTLTITAVIFDVLFTSVKHATLHKTIEHAFLVCILPMSHALLFNQNESWKIIINRFVCNYHLLLIDICSMRTSNITKNTLVLESMKKAYFDSKKNTFAMAVVLQLFTFYSIYDNNNTSISIDLKQLISISLFADLKFNKELHMHWPQTHLLLSKHYECYPTIDIKVKERYDSYSICDIIQIYAITHGIQKSVNKEQIIAHVSPSVSNSSSTSSKSIDSKSHHHKRKVKSGSSRRSKIGQEPECEKSYYIAKNDPYRDIKQRTWNIMAGLNLINIQMSCFQLKPLFLEIAQMKTNLKLNTDEKENKSETEEESNAKNISKKSLIELLPDYEYFVYLMVDKFVVSDADDMSADSNHYYNQLLYFLKMLQKINDHILWNMTLDYTYCAINKLLTSPSIGNSSYQRSALRRLASWIGKLTLSRTKPILQSRLNLKQLIIHAYQNKLLLAVLPFVSKILVCSVGNRIFNSSNPWFMSVLQLLAEVRSLVSADAGGMAYVYTIDQCFEQLNVNDNDIPPSNIIQSLNIEQRCVKPMKRPYFVDFSSKKTRIADLWKSIDLEFLRKVNDNQFLKRSLPENNSENTAFITYKNSITYDVVYDVLFGERYHFAHIIAHGFDRSACDVLPKYTERALDTAVICSQELVIKDTILLRDGNQIRLLARQMVSSLAGALSLLVCCQPLVELSEQYIHLYMKEAGIHPHIIQMLQQILKVIIQKHKQMLYKIIEKLSADRATILLEEKLHSICDARNAFLRMEHLRVKNTTMVEGEKKMSSKRNTPEKQIETQVSTVNNKSQNKKKEKIIIAKKKKKRKTEEIEGHAQTTAEQRIPVDREKYIVKVPNVERARRYIRMEHRVYEDFDSIRNMLRSSCKEGHYEWNIVFEKLKDKMMKLEMQIKLKFYNDQNSKCSLTEHQRKQLQSQIEYSGKIVDHARFNAIKKQLRWLTTHVTIYSNNNYRFMKYREELQKLMKEIAELLYALFEDDNTDGRKPSNIKIRHDIIHILFTKIYDNPNLVLHDIIRKKETLISAAETTMDLIGEQMTHVLQTHFCETLFAILRLVNEKNKIVSKMNDNNSSNNSAIEIFSRYFTDYWLKQSSIDILNVSITNNLLDCRALNVSDVDKKIASLIAKNGIGIEFGMDLIRYFVIKKRTFTLSDFQNIHSRLGIIIQDTNDNNNSSMLNNVRSLFSELNSIQRTITHARHFQYHNKVLNILRKWFAHMQNRKNRNSISSPSVASANFSREELNILGSQNNIQNFLQTAIHIIFNKTIDEMKNSDNQFCADLKEMIDSFGKLIIYCIIKMDFQQSILQKKRISLTIFQLFFRCIRIDIRQRIANHKKGTPIISVFNQRPYLRLIVFVMTDLTETEPICNMIYPSLLRIYSQFLIDMKPQQIPQFTYAWVQLLSHSKFMPFVLSDNMYNFTTVPLTFGETNAEKNGENNANTNNFYSSLKKMRSLNLRCKQIYSDLLVELLRFLHPFLSMTQLPKSVAMLYDGTLRIFLILLHDFPSFLCEHCFRFCDEIPISCIQMRNLILSAFPKDMPLPDPFQTDFNLDVPEMDKQPCLSLHFRELLKMDENRDVLPLLNKLLSSKSDDNSWAWHKTDFISFASLLLLSQSQEEINEEKQQGFINRYNIALINCIILYLCDLSVRSKYEYDLCIAFVTAFIPTLEFEGRYHLLNGICNHLRFPNSHTKFCSELILHMFVEQKNANANEFLTHQLSLELKEQIIRILLERLVVHRPHPWGLLITFVQLIKEDKYHFWDESFTHQSPDLKSLFQTVASSCYKQDITH